MPSPHATPDHGADAPATRLDRSFDRFLAHGKARAARKGVPAGNRPTPQRETDTPADGKRDGARRFV